MFPSKILLFGEYALVKGGSGFSIPYPIFSGELKFSGQTESLTSNQSIQFLFNYLKEQPKVKTFLKLDQLITDLRKGLWFDSNIPNGYGLGSSGALVAALYQHYRVQEETGLENVKSKLAIIESFFHGSSSGVDPLVSYLKQPLIVSENEVTVLSNWLPEKLGYSLFLVDTGIKSETISLVDWFKAKMLEESFREATMHNYMLPNESVIRSIEKGEPVDFENILEISCYQMEYLSPMVPVSFRKHFFAGLESEAFALKLCGSGGGGYMLCIAKNSKKAEEYMVENHLSFKQVF